MRIRRAATLLAVSFALGCGHASPAGEANAAAAPKQAQPDDLAKFQAELMTNPDDPDAHYNLALVYQLREQPDLAALHFEAAVQANPEDWHAVAKLVQVNQALGKLEERDRRRAQLFALYHAGKVVNPTLEEYCREQFRSGPNWVMVLERFELKAPRAVRYSFVVFSARPEQRQLRSFSLERYDFDQAFARAAGTLGEQDTLFHLDGEGPDGRQARYGFYAQEPSYDVTRARVVGLLDAELAQSGQQR